MTTSQIATVPTSYTLQLSEVAGGNSANVYVSDREVAAAGTETPEWTALTGSGHDSAVFLVALQPDVGSLWSYGGDITLGNNEVFTVIVESPTTLPYDNAITPASGTDYTISAGSLASTPTLDRDSGSSSVLSMTAGAGGATIQGPTDDPTIGLRVRADLLVETANGAAEGSDSTSQTAYEVQALKGYPIWPYIAADDAQTLADALIADWKDPRPLTVIRIKGFADDTRLTSTLEREISDRVRVLTPERGGIDITGWVERIDHSIAELGHVITVLAIRKVV